MKKYCLFNPDTGKIVSAVECPNDELPREGILEDSGGLAVKHGGADPDLERVEHGKKVPLGFQERFKKDRAAAWFRVRRLRSQFLTDTDFKMNGDYPLTKEEKRKLKLQRKRSRDITKTTKDPAEALSLLNEIWSDE